MANILYRNLKGRDLTLYVQVCVLTWIWGVTDPLRERDGMCMYILLCPEQWNSWLFMIWLWLMMNCQPTPSILNTMQQTLNHQSCAPPTLCPVALACQGTMTDSIQTTVKWNLLSFEVAQRWTATGHACLQPSPCNMSFVLLQWIDAAVAVIQINMACIYYLVLPVASWTSVMMTDQTVGKEKRIFATTAKNRVAELLCFYLRDGRCVHFPLLHGERASDDQHLVAVAQYLDINTAVDMLTTNAITSISCMSPITEYASKIKLRTNANLRGCFKILN